MHLALQRDVPLHHARWPSHVRIHQGGSALNAAARNHVQAWIVGSAEKRILVENHKTEFRRCLTEKMMIYALGRGTEYYDVPAVDKIVENLEKNGGAFNALLMGVIESVPFQQQRIVKTVSSSQAGQ